MSVPTTDLAALVERVASRWRRHLATVLLAGVLMYGLTWLMPTWYRSTAVLLPPEETESLAGSLSMQRMLTRMPSLGPLSQYYTPSDVFVAILGSRSVHEAVIRRFELQLVYRKRSMEKALKEFRGHVRVVTAQDGTISVSVEDRSRERAARMANALVEELDRFNVERRNSQAKRTRLFLERRVAETDSLSQRAEVLLKAYQERHHLVAPAEAERQDIGPLADLMAKRMTLEVQLSVLRSYLREDNERVIQVRTELNQLNRQIAAIPGVQSELARLVRDVRLYQQVYLLLTQQLEEARLRETMDTPTVTVLDPGMPSERRARPLRLLWTAAAMALAAAGSVLWDARPASRPSRDSVAQGAA